jgi:hypothetical protein
MIVPNGWRPPCPPLPLDVTPAVLDGVARLQDMHAHAAWADPLREEMRAVLLPLVSPSYYVAPTAL